MVKSISNWVLLLLVPCALAGTIQQNACSTECRERSLNSKFRYAVGQTYTYNFQANTKTWMLGTSNDQALLEVKGQALVTFLAECDAVLQLQQITISGNLEEKVDASDAEKRSLPFSWQDGTVDSLCPDQDEPVWVVNIKRSVLSMLQHTAQTINVAQSNVMESDVIGRCPTNYAVEDIGRVIKVTKTKIPNQCSHRVDTHNSIPTVAYHVPAETQTIPLMNSTSVCSQHIKDNVIHSVECNESHRFRPLSTERGGASTDVKTSISLISISRVIAIKPSSNPNHVPKSLNLDSRGVHDGFKDVNSVILSICQELAGDSPAHISGLFTELVYSLRKASPSEAISAWNNLRDRKMCLEAEKTEKLFLDALPQAGSTGSIAAMAEILKENKLSSRQTLGWYMSLPLSKYIDIDAIKAVMPLVDDVANSPVALFGLTGLVRRYCSKNVEECQSSAHVLSVSTKLSNMLGNKCHVGEENEVQVISVLKALGNLGVMTSEVRAIISDCAKDARLPTTIRLAAIEATRNTPCSAEVKENLMNMLENRKEDAEIRIAAYQWIMRCPCPSSIDRIQSVLNDEETNQVGGYISSHLKNIKANPNPGKEMVRNLVMKLNLENKSFPRDFLKYSLNKAVSNFCSVNNVGWDVDSNIVYSPKSFIPRSASANLSLELFGQSVNLFEFGVRTENLESLLVDYFGPGGIIESQGFGGLLHRARNSIYYFGRDVLHSLTSNGRSKRSNFRTDDLPNLDKMVNIEREESGAKLDAFLRVFGTEIGLVNYRSNGHGRTDNFESQIVDALRGLIEGAKRVDVDVARSLMFLDSSAIFPTVAGFPLRLAVNGTTTIGLGLESQLDLPALFMDPLNANIKLKVNPLAVTEITASMTVDIAVVKTGIKVAATVHSSMAVDFSAQLQEGKAVDIKLDLPKSKITLIDFKSSVMLVQQTADKSERSRPVRIINEATYNRGGCSEYFSSFTGMRLCATSSVSIPRPGTFISTDPTPDFPLSGSTSFAIVLEKTEPSMTGYMLSIKTNQTDPMSTSFLVQVNTPGSTTNREINVKAIVNLDPNVVVRLEAETPWCKSATEVELVSRRGVKSAMLKVILEDEYEFYGKLQMKLNQGNRKYSVVSTLQVGWPQQPPAAIFEGIFTHEMDRSYHFSLKPVGLLARKPFGFELTLGSEFSRNAQKVWLKNELLTPIGRALLSTEVGHQDHNYFTSFDIKYGTERKMHDVSFNAQFQPMIDDALLKTVTIFKSSQFPDMNFDMRLAIGNPETLRRGSSNVFVLVHGPEFMHSVNRLYISSSTKMKGILFTMDAIYINKFEVTYPRYAIDMKIEQSLELDDRSPKGHPFSPKYYESNFTLNVQLDSRKILDIKLDSAFAHPEFLYDISAKITYPGRTITLVDTGKWIDQKSFSISPVLQFHPGRRFEMIGKTSWTATSISIDSVLRDIGLSGNQIYSMIVNGKVDSDHDSNYQNSLGIEIQVPDMEKIVLNILQTNSYLVKETSNRLQVESRFMGELYEMSLSHIRRKDIKNTLSTTIDLSVKANKFEKMSWNMERKIHYSKSEFSDHFTSVWMTRVLGKNIATSIHVERRNGFVRVSYNFDSGHMLHAFDVSFQSTHKDNKISRDGFVELKVPLLGIPQLKLGFGCSDIRSASIIDINGQLNLEYQYVKIFSLDTLFNISELSGNALITLETPFSGDQGIKMNYHVDSTIPQIEGSLVMTWSSPDSDQPEEARIDVLMLARHYDSVHYKLTFATPIEMFKTGALSFDYRWLPAENFLHEFNIVVDLSGTIAKLDGRFSQIQPEIDLTLTLPNMNPVRFVTRVQDKPSSYIVRTSFDWGAGTLTGQWSYELTESDQSEITWMVHSPELDINHYQIKVLIKSQGADKIIVTITTESSTFFILKLHYNIELDDNWITSYGKATISLPEFQIDEFFIKFLLAEERWRDDYEIGDFHSRFEIDLTILQDDVLYFALKNLTGHVKWTTREKSSSVCVCTTDGDCYDNSFAYKDSESDYVVLREAYILSQTNSSKGVENLNGFRYKYLDDHANFERSFEVLLNEVENRKMGYKLYRDSTMTIGLDFYIPQRTIAVALNPPPKRRSREEVQFFLSIWLDKIRAPENKLVIVPTFDIGHSFEGMIGFMTSLVIQHPTLPKDLEYKMEFLSGGHRGPHHFKLDIDVMDPRHDRWILETNVKDISRDTETNKEMKQSDYDEETDVFKGGSEEDNERSTIYSNRNLTIEISLQSKGKSNVNAFLTFYLGREFNGYRLLLFNPLADHVFNFGGTLKLKAENHIEELFAHFAIRSETLSLSFGSPSKQSTLESRVNIDKNRLQLNTTTRLFGLPPTFCVLDANMSPHVDIRMSSKNDFEEYHQFVGGQMSENRFELALIRKLKMEKKELASLNMNLNRTHQLSTRLSWKLDNLREFVNSARSYSQSISRELQIIENSLTIGLFTILPNWEAFTDLSSIWENLVAHYSEQIDQIELELITEIMNEVENLWEMLGNFAIYSFAIFLDLFEDFMGFAFTNITNVYDFMLETIVDIVLWIHWKVNDSYVDLRNVIENINTSYLHEKIVKLFDSLSWTTWKSFVLPFDEFLTNLIKTYPETTRPAFRYGKIPVRRLYYYLMKKGKVSTNKVQTAEVVGKESHWTSLIGELLVYDVKNGVVHYLLPVSSKISNLQDLWMFWGLFDFQLDHLKFYIYDKYGLTFYNRLKGRASLIGSKGIVTFDKKSFDITGGNCKYLLARDFLNKEFAVAVNYETSTKDRIRKTIIFTDQDDQVEIRDDKVLINNKLAYLPRLLSTIYVFRNKNVIVVWRPGVVLSCDAINDVCTLELSPFYHGRTMGLWGNFNNEITDEMTESSGMMTRDFPSFIKSWKINKTCKDNIQTVPDSKRIVSSVHANVCSNLFVHENSDLSACFKVISPTPYNNLCLKFAVKKKSESSFRKQLESLINSYEAACYKWDVFRF